MNDDITIQKMTKLPKDVTNIIKDYISIYKMVWVNKTYYLKYHCLLKNCICLYENYIRDMIRRDNNFVLNEILRENYVKWMSMKKYTYKNLIFSNYLYFLLDYCQENESSKCRYLVFNTMENKGLCKNLFKKNIIKHIR
jgi:hypothetical protein